MIFNCSMIEPGHPCVTMSGRAFVMLRADVDEVNVQPIDLGDEVRQRVELRLDLAPVVIHHPMAREFLHRREPHTLQVIRDRFLLGPLGLVYAPAQLRKFLLRNTEGERTDRVAFAVFLGGDGWTGGKQTGGTCCSRSGQYLAPVRCILVNSCSVKSPIQFVALAHEPERGAKFGAEELRLSHAAKLAALCRPR